jgi:hypothetical protein
MKFKSALMTAASGSIGGMVASRNRGGMYLRGLVIPVNPSTAPQLASRANLAEAVNDWTNVLTTAQRGAWESYAAATPTVDRFGDTLVLSGQQMFVKSSLPRLIAGRPIVADGPITSGLATTPLISTPGSLNETSGLAGSITVPGAGTSGRLVVYMSQPLPQSRTLAHAKRRFATVFGPPTADVFTLNAAANALPYPLVEDLGARLTYVYLDDDGRASTEVSEDTIITS